MMKVYKFNKIYLKRKPIFNILLFIIDLLLSLTISRKKHLLNVASPASILLANGAHLGDVILSTCVLPVLKSAYPEVKIGFIVGSWSKLIVDKNPLVDFVHTVDHWKLNRNSCSLYAKFKQYIKTYSTALREIRDIKYDISIDLYTCFPNMIPLLWYSKIPVRIGYISSGFGPLLTTGLFFREQANHETQYQLDLIRQLPIEDSHFNRRHSVLPTITREAEKEVSKLIGVDFIADARYRIIHMGSGLLAKEWPERSWRLLAERLVNENILLLFTGNGSREHEKIERTITTLPNCINACNRLSWLAYLAALQHAELLYCTDSMPGHAAAAFNTKCVIVYSGVTSPDRWKPLSNANKIVTYKMPCSPCYKKNGCEHMKCIRGISVDQIYNAGLNLCSQL